MADPSLDPDARDARFRVRPSRLVLVLSLACAALIGLDLALVFRVRALNQRVGSLTRLVAAAERPLLVEGEAFPALTLLDAGSRAVPLLDASAPAGTLLLVSSQSCDACEGVRPVWDEVAELCAGSPLRVLELVLDAKPSALSRDRRCPALASGGDAWGLIGRIPGVPAAILVDGNGTVRRAFYGSDHVGLRHAVEEALGP